ncbi:MAG: BMP family ABC transporter substrate-binding protein [Lachnospiraceae bacterium]|nr:BMP family ABC transporter substrate-binding protein [Lachnospiraceae bacterium]MDE6185480.1 BMP family ABC transporter substrate-binding protein [Lachnospiraceae bacterium]
MGIRIRKKIADSMMILLLAGMLAGCNGEGAQETISEEAKTPLVDIEIQKQQREAARVEPMADLLKDHYGDYQEKGGEIAFVSDGVVMDGNYNEVIYEGVQMYALAAGVSFSYYNVEEDNLEGHVDTVENAIVNNAKVVVCAGYDFQEAVGELQNVYPDISFLLIDGVPVDTDGEPLEIEDNVHCVSFKEEESGYLAGYMAVLEGYRNLGFIGGKEEPPVIRYGYGYLQGIDDAARELELEDVTVNYWYAGTFQSSEEICKEAERWYEEGTEVIFACGGFLYESVLEAARRENGLLIGVDVDQNERSQYFLTSAVKDIANAVVISLDDYFAEGGKWSEAFAGENVRYGVEDNCTGIPVLETEWKFQRVTMEKFYEVYTQVRQGEKTVSEEIEERPQVSVAVKYL